MNASSRMFVPLFILFALILATVWVLTNRQGLIGAYHKQLLGNASAVGVEWMDKLAQLTDPISAVLAVADKDNEGTKSEDIGKLKTLLGHNKGTVPPLDQNSDENKEEEVLVLEEYQEEDDDQPQGEKLRNLRISPDLDLKREFASDKANPYIQDINENYDLTFK